MHLLIREGFKDLPTEKSASEAVLNTLGARHSIK